MPVTYAVADLPVQSTHLWLTANELVTHGFVSAHDATYRGFPGSTRDTRLAASIWTLVHEYGWVVRPFRRPKEQGTYFLVHAGEMPERYGVELYR
jgi:hypothetical protein